MEAESQDVKKLEKMFKKQLNEIEVDKEILENRLKNKLAEVKQLHMQYRDKDVSSHITFWYLFSSLCSIRFISEGKLWKIGTRETASGTAFGVWSHEFVSFEPWSLSTPIGQ